MYVCGKSFQVLSWLKRLALLISQLSAMSQEPGAICLSTTGPAQI